MHDKKALRAIGLLVAMLSLLCLVPTASAREVKQYFYSGTSFGTGGTRSSSIAFDAANQKVLLVDVGSPKKGLKISKFTPAGAPDPFSGRAGATSFNTGAPFAGGEVNDTTTIAVDDSGTATAGNFYIAHFEYGLSTVFGYTSAGTALSGFPYKIPGACGIAVAPDGGVWVASREVGSYRQFRVAERQIVDTVLLGGGKAGCRVAIDSEGDLFLANGDRLAKYDSAPSHSRLFDLAPGTPRIALEREGDTTFTLFGDRVTQRDPSGDTLTLFGGPDPAHSFYPGLSAALDLAVNPQTGDIYVIKDSFAEDGSVDIFSRESDPATAPRAITGEISGLTGSSAVLHGVLNPDGVSTTDCYFEWGAGSAYGNTVPCAESNTFAGDSVDNQVTAPLSGLAKGTVYHYRLVAKNLDGILGYGRDAEFSAASSPVIGDTTASHITTDSARIEAGINPNGAGTSFRVEFGIDSSYGTSAPVPDARPSDLNQPGAGLLTVHGETQEIAGLQPETLYHYRVVATNAAGVTEGADHTFTTFALPSTEVDTCPNAQVRQQTSAAHLPDCRAYELVSAADTGGYDVRSDLSSGMSPLATSPAAADRVLYSMQSGTIPGIAGNPTNRGADPYTATRGEGGWSTRYVGLAANNPFATEPFASPLSGFDSSLQSFAFGGAEICDPCFADGSTNVPLRLADGSLVEGMTGSMDPGPAEPAGMVKQPLSEDGSHLVFATTAQFEADANSNGTDATIYVRDLKAGTTQVVSKTETGATIANGLGVAELGISEDGSRVVFGELLSSDALGNDYYHLYMRVGEETVDLMPGAVDGGLYGGMTANGSMVYFTTRDSLSTASDQDSDTSADVFRAEVDGASALLTRVSAGSSSGDTDGCDPAGNSFNPDAWNVVPGTAGDCSAVAIGGGGGVAAGEGSAYFLSPERLDGSNGIDGAPNLYLARPGFGPRFVATLESGANQPVPDATHPLLSSFKSPVNSSLKSFVNPEGIAIEQASGSIYVLDTANTEASPEDDPPAYVKKFDTTGNLDTSFGVDGKLDGSNTPAGSFAEVGNGEALGLPIGVATQVAVDNSPTSPSYGDLYVPDTVNSVVDKFDSEGNYISQVESGLVTGVAVSPLNGDVYTVNYFGEVKVFDANGAALSSFMVSELAANSIAVDSSGSVYVTDGAKASVYDASGAFVKVLDPNPSFGVAVDPADDHVYVDEGSEVVEFDAAGNQVGAAFGSGTLSKSVGLAVESGRAVVSNGGSGTIAIFGPREIPSAPGYDSPLVIDSVKDAGGRHSEDLQVTESGDHVVFSSTLPLNGYESAGRYEVFTYSAPNQTLDCASCSPTGARPDSDATLSVGGLNLLEDGSVFFTTGESLALRDSNSKQDAYEWHDNAQSLISTGTSESDSSLLSVSSDGENAFFFTRQKLVPADQNGSAVRLYTARKDGGFAFGPPQFQCAASDECRGAGSQPAPAPGIGTLAGTPGQFAKPPSRCRKGTVKRRGRCVKRAHKRQQHKRASAKHGGGK